MLLGCVLIKELIMDPFSLNTAGFHDYKHRMLRNLTCGTNLLSESKEHYNSLKLKISQSEQHFYNVAQECLKQLSFINHYNFLLHVK